MNNTNTNQGRETINISPRQRTTQCATQNNKSQKRQEKFDLCENHLFEVKERGEKKKMV